MKETIGNPILKKIADNVVDTMSSMKVTSAIGIVESYREISNTLEIICSVNGSERRYLFAPIIFTPNAKVMYKQGDNVFVLFLYNDIDYPFVLGKVDENYTVNSRNDFRDNYINL